MSCCGTGGAVMDRVLMVGQLVWFVGGECDAGGAADRKKRSQSPEGLRQRTDVKKWKAGGGTMRKVGFLEKGRRGAEQIEEELLDF